MNRKTVLVVATETQAEGVYSYAAFVWTVGEDGKGTFGTDTNVNPVSSTRRNIGFDVGEDLSWRAAWDTVNDCRWDRHYSGPFETPEIASDDVGNDMLEVALATAFPYQYGERNRLIEEAASSQLQRENDRECLPDYGEPVG